MLRVYIRSGYMSSGYILLWMAPEQANQRPRPSRDKIVPPAITGGIPTPFLFFFRIELASLGGIPDGSAVGPCHGDVFEGLRLLRRQLIEQPDVTVSCGG